MGDTSVDFFLETLKQLTTSSDLDFIMDDEKHQLQSLVEEIKHLRGFLRNTEKKRNEHSEVMKLVMQIRDVVSEAENIVELFVSHAFKAYASPFQNNSKMMNKKIKKKSLPKNTTKKKAIQEHRDYLSLDLEGLLKTRVKKKKNEEVIREQQDHLSLDLDSVQKEIMTLTGDQVKKEKKKTIREHQDHLSLDLESVKKEIKTLTAEVKKIYNENMYDINGAAVKKLEHSSAGSGGGPGSSGGSNPSKVAEEKVVVGFKDEVETLMRKLHDSGESGVLEIISIVGAAGGGKTTLAREVYDQRLTSTTFEIRAWVVISQDYDKNIKRDLLMSILKSAFPENHEDYEKSSEDMLGEKLLKCLKGKKYLIVMDDIWGIEAWNDIQRSFPRDRMGSKVMFTSRLPVQSDSIRCVPHCLVPLPKSCSWELLEKKVFGMKQCPPKLVDIGKQIAEKCKGLPLAIVTIAGILATEDKTLNVWEEVAKNLSTIIAKKQEGCMEILELSYNHLPLHLKACFLYIGAHPEDYEIPIRELIWLWIAEGFIQQSEGGKSLEDVAEDYLIGLIDRSLVMVARRSRSHGGIKACRIHDLLRELCLKKAEEDNFLVQIYRDDSFSPSATNKHPRLFISNPFFQKFSSRLCALNLRSFLSFSLPNSKRLFRKNLSFFIGNFKLLRVLHFIPAASPGMIEIGDLVHLRYLATRLYNWWDEAPECCFYYLWNLETLNLQTSSNEGTIPLPRDIVKMVKLRHLYSKLGMFEYHHVSCDEDKGNLLDSLQTLHGMCTCEHCLRFLKRTPNLRNLKLIDGLHFEGDDVLTLPDLEFLKCLETLTVITSSQRARVTSTGLKFPPTLMRLNLWRTHLEWEELSIILQTLPSLEVLKLSEDACVGPVWNTSELEGWLSQLKYLRLYHLDIKEWNASEDQFPRLEVIVIELCRILQGIPIEFANLYDLREIKVEYCRESLEESAREIQEKQRYTKGDDDCLNLFTTHNYP